MEDIMRYHILPWRSEIMKYDLNNNINLLTKKLNYILNGKRYEDNYCAKLDYYIPYFLKQLYIKNIFVIRKYGINKYSWEFSKVYFRNEFYYLIFKKCCKYIYTCRKGNKMYKDYLIKI